MKRSWSAVCLLWCCVAFEALAQAPAPAPKPDAPQAPAEPAAKPAEVPAALRPNVLVSVTPNQGLFVGDATTLKIEATLEPNVQISVPEQSLAPFEVLARRTHDEPVGERHRFVFELDLLALEPGELTIPALRVRLVDAQGTVNEVKTEPKTVQVKSLIANEPNAAPKPPTKPVSVMQDDYTLAWVGGGLLAAAAVALITLYVSRWLARRPKAAPPPPPPRPAWELALEKLAQLERQKAQLLEAERGEEFVDGVSDALREYLGKRYGFEGLESTTDEVLRALERIRPHKLSLSGVSLLLDQCDLVKFARVKPDLTQCDDLWNGAVGLVRATTPAPEPAAAEVMRS